MRNVDAFRGALHVVLEPHGNTVLYHGLTRHEAFLQTQKHATAAGVRAAAYPVHTEDECEACR